MIDALLLAALERLLALAGPAGSETIRAAAVAITPLGGSPVLAPIVATGAAWLALQRRRPEARWLLVTCVAAWAAMHALKIAVARPRPDVAGHLVEAAGASFPSGHAMMSMVVALSLWRVLASGAAGHRCIAIGAGTAGALLVLAIGASRVLLGVHWPTDVLAGWVMGAGWATLAWHRRPVLH